MLPKFTFVSFYRIFFYYYFLFGFTSCKCRHCPVVESDNSEALVRQAVCSSGGPCGSCFTYQSDNNLYSGSLLCLFTKQGYLLLLYCLTCRDKQNSPLLSSTVASDGLTLRRLMSYIYIYIYIYIWSTHSCCFQITHNDAAQSVGLLWTSDQLVAETST